MGNNQQKQKGNKSSDNEGEGKIQEEQEDLQAEDLPKFDEVFPKLTLFLKQFPELKEYQEIFKYCNDPNIDAKLKRHGLYEFMYNLQENYFLQGINKEIQASVPEWKELWKIQDGLVCVHTFAVLYCMISDSEFPLKTDCDQNILKWACLLHDIKKHGPPVIQGKDHMHPFKGGAAVLEIFKRLGCLKFVNEVTIRELQGFILNSKQNVPESLSKRFKPGQKYCTVMHSYNDLDKIFKVLWNKVAPRGSPIDLVFRLVLFHQSLAGCDDFPNMIDLQKQDRINFCKDQDGRFYHLMKLLMICDATSYIFILDEQGNKELFRKQISQHSIEFLNE